MAKSALYVIFGKLSAYFGRIGEMKRESKEIKKFFKGIILERINSTNPDDLKHKK